MILCGFAIIVGFLTTRQIEIQFNDSVRRTAQYLAERADVRYSDDGFSASCGKLGDLSSGEGAKVAVYDLTNRQQMCVFGSSLERALVPHEGSYPRDEGGYRVEARQVQIHPIGTGILLYARPLSATKATAAKVRVFLALGVLGGTALALAAGLLVARRAMAPVQELTATAREIARTRDPSRHLPMPEADDEVAELARTLDGMLEALDAAQSETEAMLERQREFVADASHELRTPLTSVLANLELLEETLEGDERDAAASALRSSRRMRRLVADLLLLARADAGRVVPHHPTDLAQILFDVAAELEPLAARDGHELSVDVGPPGAAAVVSGARDELHRLALNLIENALRHTPPGTHVHAALGADDEGHVVLTVQDDGPGIPPELRARLFERFVRGAGDGGGKGGGSGLGLSIVRAVAVSHGGDVAVDDAPGGGARFTVRLPALPMPQHAPVA
ncbi:signal transduction histidine kinase [Conexibacter arvalis]|uniref:histidine kinase n=1 Tax=Conexibacter arvalis TaxID=912552 RepID=A0A840IHJ1_9ACTN|nr:signal transduction histidine kinase [Conexibacter arvalis]